MFVCIDDPAGSGDDAELPLLLRRRSQRELIHDDDQSSAVYNADYSA